jgi:threonyl-tRNA synthetase
VDEGGETFNKKIRNAVTSKIPNIWIIGEEETNARAITWRRYCVKDQVKMPMDRAVDAMTTMKRDRTMDNFPDVTIPE